MRENEINEFITFWLKGLKKIQNSINQGVIKENDLEIIEEYKEKLELQSNNKLFNRFNKLFFELDKIISEDYYFDPTYNKYYRMLLPEIKKFKRITWDKTRNLHIDLINKIENELKKIIQSFKSEPIDFSKTVPKYNPKKQSISFGEIEIILERDSKENSFCKILFEEMKTNDSLSWDEFLEKMGENIDEIDKAEQKMVYDLNRNLNLKVKNKLNNKNVVLSKWEKKQIVRKF